MSKDEFAAVKELRDALHEQARLAKFYREHTFTESDENKLIRIMDTASTRRDSAEKRLLTLLREST